MKIDPHRIHRPHSNPDVTTLRDNKGKAIKVTYDGCPLPPSFGTKPDEIEEIPYDEQGRPTRAINYKLPSLR